MSIDISKLNSFSQETYHKIIAKHPEWEKFASIYEGWKELLMFKIPPPVPDIPPIKIIAESDDLEEITIYFGIAHYHMGIYLSSKESFWRHRKKTLDDQLNAIYEITEMIFNEELIAVQHNPGFFSVAEGIITLDEYKKLLEKGRLRKAVSWKGTYNFPKDGTHLEWNPKLMT